MAAKIHYGRANKDYPEFGVARGDMHYSWSLFRQPTRRSMVRPTRSQLEASPFRQQLFEIIDTSLPNCISSGDLEDVAAEIRQLAEEERDKVQDLPENFQQGDVAQKMEARADELEAWADEIDSAVEELGTLEEWSERKVEEDEDGEDETAPDKAADTSDSLAEKTTTESESTNDSDIAGYGEAVAEKVAELADSAPDPE